MNGKQIKWKYVLHFCPLRPWGGMWGLPQHLFEFSFGYTFSGYCHGSTFSKGCSKTSYQQNHLSATLLLGLCQQCHPETSTLKSPSLPWKHLKDSQLRYDLGSPFRLCNNLYSDNMPFTFTLTHSPRLQAPVGKSYPCITLNLSLVRTHTHTHTHTHTLFSQMYQ